MICTLLCLLLYFWEKCQISKMFTESQAETSMLMLLSPGSLLLRSDCIKDALLLYALEFQQLLKLLTSDFLKKT